jgi:hypothetical protein
MQQYTLPYVLTPGAPSLFKDLPFNAALLLPVSLDVSLTAHAKFLPGCEDGFDWYFESMHALNDDGVVFFADSFYAWDEVQSFLTRNVLPDVAVLRSGVSPQKALSLLSWRAGFCLGWLSALALTDRALALQGLAFLTYLVSLQYSSL